MEAVAESTFTAKQAAAWVGRVNANLANLAHLITDGYQHRVWEALGYQSWAEMCEAEVNVPQLSRDQRRELVGSLRSEGMSTRAIAAATGTSQMTAQRDVEAGESND
jgi:hypothetical protein